MCANRTERLDSCFVAFVYLACADYWAGCDFVYSSSFPVCQLVCSRLPLKFMDGLSYTTIIEPSEPLARWRGSALDR